MTSFYDAFAPLCFTLLGLWLIVVQTRHEEWRRSPAHRTRAYALSLNFALPGTMALMALIDPGNHTIWRVAFATVAVCALAALTRLSMGDRGRAGSQLLSRLTTGLVGLLYLLVVVVALGPTIPRDIGIQLTALSVEEILLAVLVLVAVNVAWFLMFEEAELPPASRPHDAGESDQP